MKIRTDFVTNSSSANFLVELTLIADSGETVETSVAVSPEDCDLGIAENISLTPTQKNDVYFSGKAISEAEDIDELCDMLFGATIIEGWYEENDDEDDCEDESFFDTDIEKTVKEVAPDRVTSFANKCKKSGITKDNLKTIIIKNSQEGDGDSAMYIECSVFDEYKERYNAASESERTAILQELVEYIKSEPVVKCCDNSYLLDDKMPCAWGGTEEKLVKSMKKFLEGKNKRDYWMGKYSKVYTIDVEGKRVTGKTVLYFTDI